MEKIQKIAGGGYQVSASAKADIMGIKDAARITVLGKANVSAAENSNVFYEDFAVGNPGFLSVFDFKLSFQAIKAAIANPVRSLKPSSVIEEDR